MTPHTAGGRGTFILDRKTRVGRIAVASGTKHAPTFRRLNEMITALDETGRSDLLREIRDGRLKALDVYEAFRVNELHKLPLGDMLRPLSTALDAWYDALDPKDVSASQLAMHRMMKKRLAKKGAPVAELPRLLAEQRDIYRAARHPASFNRIRASVLAFVRDTLKRSHRLYGEVRDVAVLKEKKSPKRQPQTFAQLLAHSEKMVEPRDNAAFWAMALTGMGGKEHFIDGYLVKSDRVAIYGVKREKRSRVVPRVMVEYYLKLLPVRTVGGAREQRVFGERLLERCDIHTYDLRRSYANFLEAAGIPRTRRKLYLGHSGGDVTSLYEQHEVDQFLAADAVKIEAHLKASVPSTLELMK